MKDNNLEPKDRKAFWNAHIEAQRAEPISKRAYCLREGIGYPSFLRWESKLAERPATDFVELKTFQPDEAQELVIHVVKGVRIHISSPMDSERIVRILEVLLSPA